jgi:hypothetical protein
MGVSRRTDVRLIEPGGNLAFADAAAKERADFGDVLNHGSARCSCSIGCSIPSCGDA